MSFSSNPYAHMNLVTAPPRDQTLIPQSDLTYWEGREDVVEVRCNGCGAQDVAKGAIRRDDPISKARNAFDNHILHSHGRVPGNFATWGWD